MVIGRIKVLSIAFKHRVIELMVELCLRKILIKRAVFGLSGLTLTRLVALSETSDYHAHP